MPSLSPATSDSEVSFLCSEPELLGQEDPEEDGFSFTVDEEDEETRGGFSIASVADAVLALADRVVGVIFKKRSENNNKGI